MKKHDFPGHISTVDADLILYTVQQVELDQIPVDIAAPKIVTEPAFRISFLFSYFYQMFVDSLEAVGLLDSMAVSNAVG